MGMVANTKQFLAKKAASTAQKVGDGVAICSTLSPKQLQDIEEKRVAFLSEKPNMSGEEIRALIQNNMGAIGIEVYQSYLEQLDTVYSPVEINLSHFDEDNRIRFFDITKWVTDAEEQSLDKLVNVYHVLSEDVCNIALIYHRSIEQCTVTLAVINTDEGQSDPAIVDKYYSRVIGAIKGNFPGAEIQGLNSKDCDYGIGIPPCLSSINGADTTRKVKSIAMVSNVASEKSEAFISQSMEKLLDGIVPEDKLQEYTIVLLANPVKEQLKSKNRLYELYTALAPYSSWQTGYTYTEADGVSASANVGVNLGIGAGKNLSANASLSVPTEAGMACVGASAGYSTSANFGVSFSRASSVTVNIGKNESISQNYTNYGVKHTLDILEAQLKRIEESSALGMWEFASYIISDSPVIANNVAHMYLALTQGEESYLTKAAVNFWDGDIDVEAARSILCSVQKLQHPVFGLKSSLEDEWLMYPTLVTPTTPLSGKELAKALNFPRRSVSGLPVLECASFGREVQRFTETQKDKRQIEIGSIYHMRRTDPQTVALDVDSLASHVFVSGSTGSGKSNTIYHILDTLLGEDVKFMVVEPAKGEYKEVFGGRKDVTVYGTNLKKSELLRINPFSFPDDIHVLEHIDRLIEIFNACWPMYAAMPAVLKDAVEQAYTKRGWSLTSFTRAPFPTFCDLLTELPLVMERSAYSKDTKGDYVGALVTRVKSLTNGINGQIFCGLDELSNEDLFDKNIIVDLSRVGSSETKSLIMGLMVMKLQEYRMHQKDRNREMNSDLKHVTVLEEAHNLLRRTSAEQSQEGSNLQGKSVEMLANAIAEMRTYGEGFIIADQSPGLLDLSVIRNTNTKILMRLPDQSDRELVGKSIGLNDDQIMELSKLEKGVAAVYQNDWLEAVLCKINHFTDKSPDGYEAPTHPPVNAAREAFLYKLIHHTTEQNALIQENADSLKLWIAGLDVGNKTKNQLITTIDSKATVDAEKKLLYKIVHGETLCKKIDKFAPEDGVLDYMRQEIMDNLQISQELAMQICQCTLNYVANTFSETNTFVEKINRIKGVL